MASASEPGPVRRAILKVTAEVFLFQLERMDGERRFRVHGLPPGLRVVGVHLEHWGDHVISLLLEGDALELMPEGSAIPEIKPVVEEIR
jgi:hypothetical protein